MIMKTLNSKAPEIPTPKHNNTINMGHDKKTEKQTQKFRLERAELLVRKASSHCAETDDDIYLTIIPKSGSGASRITYLSSKQVARASKQCCQREHVIIGTKGVVKKMNKQIMGDNVLRVRISMADIQGNKKVDNCEDDDSDEEGLPMN